MPKTISARAMDAALKFGQREDWVNATLCILYAMQIDGQSITSIPKIQQKFFELGFELQRLDVASSLDALEEAGLIGVSLAEPPDELGMTF